MSWQQQQQQPYGAGGFQPQQTGFQPQQTGFQQQQTGFQPQQTGFQPQQTGFQPQQTGFQQQQPRFLSSQQTGFPSQQFGGLQSQQTGYPTFQSQGLAPPLAQQSTQRPQNTGGSTGGGAGNYAFLNAPPASSNMGGMQPQATGWQGGLSSQPTGYGGGGHSGLLAQPTGAPPRLMAQPTGMPHDPRLQMMSAHFMPGNTSAPFSSSGAPSLPAPLGGQTSFQSLLSNPTINTPKVPWTLSKQEKKDYDQIFRAWDQTGDGFISGDMAREVFGQSGLGRDDLMKIWNLSDVDNRGKLNLPEFHIAMGLIYRALNGNTIPDTLPEELIPPSMRDIDTTVTFMRDLLRHDASSRSTTSSPGFGYGSSTPVPAGASKDAKVYKHDDSRTSSGYKSSSRHLDRKSVRYAGEDSGAELGDLKRQLANSSAQLDQSADEFARRTEEDEALEQEVEDLKYRVKRVKDDIDYVSRGKRTPEKDEERRKLERELLYLMHEKLPEVERKQEENELRKKRDERAGARARDRRNDTYGRKDYTSDRDRDRDEYRGTFERERDYERERERDRDYRDRDRPRSRSREHNRGDSYDRRPRSPIATSRTPPPEPEAPSKSNHIAVPPPAPPKPTASTPAAPSTKNMTPEERTAFIRAQAQKRIQDRLKALGVETAQPDAPVVDKSVEERLAREKQEAEEKLKAAETEQAAREDARKKRLEAAGGPPEAPKPPAASSSAAKPPPAPPSKSAMKKPPPAPVPRSQKAPSAPPPAPTAPTLDPEDEELRQREEARARASAERKARLKKLEEEEEEERRKEEEYLAARKAKSAPKEAEAPAPPPAPPAPPALADGGSYNPFHRKTSASGAVASPPSAVPAAGGFNPFFRPPAASPAPASPVTSPPPPPAPPAPPAPAPPAPVQQSRSAPAPAPEEDWDVIAEKDDDSDSSDDDYANSRGARGNLARALFGNILPPTSRPTSAGPGSASPTSASAPPPAPKMPPAALANLGGATPADPSARGALFASIQGGAKLRKAVTVDKSGPQVSGRVVGDAGPPEHITAALAAPRSPSPPPVDDTFDEPPARHANRQSVDWYAGLATDTSHPSADYQPLEATKEEQSPVRENGHQDPIEASEEPEDPTAEFDMTKDIRVRTLYPYDGQRDVDLSFIENVVIVAHPAKDPESPWWYGTLVEEGRSGWFPHAYVEEMRAVKAKALYAYAGGGQEELPFEENDILDIVDHSDNDWWKTEKAGVVFIVPAAYLELQGELKVSPITYSRKQTPFPDAAAPTVNEPAANPKSPANEEPFRGPSVTIADDNSETDNESDSSADSFLSFDDTDDEDVPDSAKNEEKKRREVERQRVLAAAGLKVRREPPGVPARRQPPAARKRRPPPAAPASKRDSVATLSLPSVDVPLPAEAAVHQEDTPQEQTQDAYDRYENFLEQAKKRPNRSRGDSYVRPVSTATIGSLDSASMASPSASSVSVGRDPGASSGGKLTGFLSKLIAPAPVERKTPAISGPISSAPMTATSSSPGNDTEDRPDSTSFGQTWGSLVDPSVLATMSVKEKKRQEAIFEFIGTESAYVRDLQLIVEVFYASMLNMLDDKALTVIFANIEDILLFNTGFLSSLEERQKASRLYVDTIGDIFEQHIASISVYLPYCVNQAQAIKLLQSLRQADPALASHLQNIRDNEPAVRSLDLSSFLLQPMQRLTRYPLLLRQIIHYTEPDHDLKQIEKALMTAESIVANVNESVRESEGHERLRVLSEDLWIGGEGRLDLTAPTALQGPRRLIKEGTVSKAKSGRKLQLVLCNDIVVLIESRNLYRMPMPLHEVVPREVRDETGFQLKLEYSKGSDVIALKTSSAKEAQAWIKAIETARIRSIDARKRHAHRRSRASSLGYDL